MTEARIELPPKLVPVFTPQRGEVRYRYSFGGRGSGKSHSFALMAAVFGYAEPLRILATREFQVSIRESFHAEIAAAIRRFNWLDNHYEIGESFITGKNGTEFIFRGLRRNMPSIKSMSGIDLCIVEEAESVPESSWRDLLPTIRADKSEIWVVWNPRDKGSPVDERFRISPPANSIGAELNWSDNPWFPTVLDSERKHDQQRMDHGTYAHIWEGQYLERSDAQVFKNWWVDDFDSDPAAVYRLGADWGFSVDPSVLVRCYIDGKRLYIDHEAYMVGCEIDQLPDLFAGVPESDKWWITADSARPETISYLKSHGYPKINAATKGPKSVEEGIAWLQSFDIVVHPRCKHTIKELETYSYKVDPLTGQVLPVLADKMNHCIDSIRYACEGARRAIKTVSKDAARPMQKRGGWMR